MTLTEYIRQLTFSEIRFFQKKQKVKGVRVYANGQNLHYYNDQENGYITQPIENFELKFVSLNIDYFKSKILNGSISTILTSSIYDTTSVIQFINGQTITGELNCNFLKHQFLNKEWQTLTFESNTVQDLYNWAKEEGYTIFPYSARNLEGSKWQYFNYPESYYFNIDAGLFETSIYLNLNSINNKPWRLEIPSQGNQPTTTQIEKIEKLYAKRWDLRTEILNRLYHYYQTTARHDFNLPELNNQDQLLYFLRNGSIILSEAPDDPIYISFGTWDEEHGASYCYHAEDGHLEES